VQEYRLALADLPDFLTKTYLFLFLLNWVSYTTVFFIRLKIPTKAGFAFLGFSLIKLMLATAFLWFPLQSNPVLKEQIVLHFMTPYLLLLIWEVSQVYELLKNEWERGVRAK